MADRFPLIVNSVSKKIEELVSGDNLDLTGNGIIVSGDTGSGKYLTSDGTTVFWGNPGDVYLTQTQTLTNKTLESGVISGALNTLTDIPNSALVNSGITVNNITIPLGGSVVTPDNNTTYVVSAQDGLSASEKIIRLTSAGNAGAGINDDVILAVGVPTTVPSGSNTVSLFLDRVGDKVTVSGHVVDNNTITTISAPGGTNTSGAIDFTSTGAATVSMTGSTVNIDALDTDTRTKIRAGSGGSYGPADTQQGLFTFLDGTGTVVAQGVDGNGDPTITYTSSDTVTQVRGGSTGTYTPAVTGTSTTQISFEGGSALGGNTQVTQNGNTILIDSTDTNTVTKVGSDNNGSPIAPQAGDFIFKQSGATTITQSTNGSGQVEITVSSINSDTGAILTASNGIILDTSDFKLKNASNLSGNRVTKWDDGNAQLADSIISDDGSTVTIAGDLQVDGSQTILNTSVLQVEDNIIELRKGTSIVGADGGIQVNRTTDANDVVTSYKQLQWHESGGYWRSWDGSVEQRLVTEIETQVLTNKTLTSPTLTSPSLGAATATSINGLEIASTASAVLDVQSGKTVDINNDLTFKSDNNTGNTNVNFRVGGDVAFKSDTLASFASTTATQLRTLISGTTGVDDLVFQTNPVILTGLTTTSTGFALINSGAQSIQFGGAATAIDIGNTSGTTTISGDLVVEKDLTVGGANTDLFTCNARIDVANSDILIRGGTSDPMTVGRGNSAISTNTAVGKQALLSAISGSQNSAVGYESLLTINAGAGNTGLGHQVLRSTGVGNANTAVGRGAMLSNLSGDNNVALGANSLETNTTGSSNVCIGFYAGYNAAGSGNVLIGPADSGNPVNDATYSPLNPSGDRQLVIGSGTEFWVRGDSNFDVTISNDLTVNTDLTVKGDLVVNGVTTTIKSNTLEVSDKNIELAKVVSTQFTCTTADGSANISSISPTLGLIPGMVVTSNTGGVSVPNNTTIVSLSGNTAVLSNNVTGTGTPTFSAIGPSDSAADGGGIILDGTTDHTFTWSNANDSWQSSENMDLVNGKTYNIIDGSGNARQMLSLTQIGPTAGTGVVAGLGSGVTSSVLTSVGTLTSLDVSGNTTLNTLTIESATAAANALMVSANYVGAGNVDIQTWQRVGGAVQAKLIYKDASTDMHFGTDTSHNLHFMTGGTDAMKINTSGVVGINEEGTMGQLNIKNENDFDSSSITTNTDNIFLVSDATSADNAYGASIGFSRVQYSDRRAAAITVVQEGTDEDRVGLSFFTHPSADASLAVEESFRVGHHGVITSTLSSGSHYSQHLLEITTSATPTQCKIITSIPWTGDGSHAHSVRIAGFRYGGQEMVDLQIGWHVYNNSFYNRIVSSSGSWAPTITLAVENGYVVIHLSSPGYWPKLYVESLYHPYGSLKQANNWTWTDAAISGDTGLPVETVPYKSNFGNGVTINDSNGLSIMNSHITMGSGWGINFADQTATSASGAAATSEVLDHYERGHWDPTFLKDGTTAAALDWKWGDYVRVGDIVHVSFSLGLDNDTDTYTTAKIGGFPFSVDFTANNSNHFFYVPLGGYEWETNYGDSGDKTGLYLQPAQASGSSIQIFQGLSKGAATSGSFKSSQRLTATFSYCCS